MCSDDETDLQMPELSMNSPPIVKPKEQNIKTDVDIPKLSVNHRNLVAVASSANEPLNVKAVLLNNALKNLIKNDCAAIVSSTSVDKKGSAAGKVRQKCRGIHWYSSPVVQISSGSESDGESNHPGTHGSNDPSSDSGKSSPVDVKFDVDKHPLAKTIGKATKTLFPKNLVIPEAMKTRFSGHKYSFTEKGLKSSTDSTDGSFQSDDQSSSRCLNNNQEVDNGCKGKPIINRRLSLSTRTPAKNGNKQKKTVHHIRTVPASEFKERTPGALITEFDNKNEKEPIAASEGCSTVCLIGTASANKFKERAPVALIAHFDNKTDKYPIVKSKEHSTIRLVETVPINEFRERTPVAFMTQFDSKSHKDSIATSIEHSSLPVSKINGSAVLVQYSNDNNVDQVKMSVSMDTPMANETNLNMKQVTSVKLEQISNQFSGQFSPTAVDEILQEVIAPSQFCAVVTKTDVSTKDLSSNMLKLNSIHGNADSILDSEPSLTEFNFSKGNYFCSLTNHY